MVTGCLQASGWLPDERNLLNIGFWTPVGAAPNPSTPPPEQLPGHPPVIDARFRWSGVLPIFTPLQRYTFK